MFKKSDEEPKKSKKKLSRKEVKNLRKEKKRWETFAKLLDDKMSELKRVTRFNEMCDVIENFIKEADYIFQGENEEINRMLDKFEKYLDKIQAENRESDAKSKKLIEELVSTYNAEVGGDLVFDGDVERWFRRAFPLVALYAKNKNDNAS